MTRAIHFIATNIPGYGPSDGSCLPCSGVSHNSFSQIQISSLTCSSRSTSFICNANSGSYRRNPDFIRQNKNGFSRNRNKQNDEENDAENLEESEIFSSKNGPLLSAAGTPKFQATATPGPREKDIVELFRKVQAQLRARAAIKEEKNVEDSKGVNKQNETVDSLLTLLRKHSVQQGKRTNRSGNSNRDFILESNNNTVKHETLENDTPSVNRPISNFRRRSPVPQIKFKEISPKVDAIKDTSPKFEPDPEPEPEFDEILDEISEIDVEEEVVIEETDLSGMKVTELRAIAKSRGLKGFSKMKKSDLIELLTGGTI